MSRKLLFNIAAVVIILVMIAGCGDHPQHRGSPLTSRRSSIPRCSKRINPLQRRVQCPQLRLKKLRQPLLKKSRSTV